MSSHPLKEYDVVKLLIDLPQEALKAGDVGVILVVFGDDAFEVEFCDDSGRPKSKSVTLTLSRDQVVRIKEA